MKKFISIIMVLAMVLSFAGCSGESAEGKFTVGICQLLPHPALDAATQGFMDAITEALEKGDKVQLIGFGSFEVNNRAARTGRNPKTKEAIEIAASKFPVFKAGKALKDKVAE